MPSSQPQHPTLRCGAVVKEDIEKFISLLRDQQTVCAEIAHRHTRNLSVVEQVSRKECIRTQLLALYHQLQVRHSEYEAAYRSGIVDGMLQGDLKLGEIFRQAHYTAEKIIKHPMLFYNARAHLQKIKDDLISYIEERDRLLHNVSIAPHLAHLGGSHKSPELQSWKVHNWDMPLHDAQSSNGFLYLGTDPSDGLPEFEISAEVNAEVANAFGVSGRALGE